MAFDNMGLKEKRGHHRGRVQANKGLQERPDNNSSVWLVLLDPWGAMKYIWSHHCSLPSKA